MFGLASATGKFGFEGFDGGALRLGLGGGGGDGVGADNEGFGLWGRSGGSSRGGYRGMNGGGEGECCHSFPPQSTSFRCAQQRCHSPDYHRCPGSHPTSSVQYQPTNIAHLHKSPLLFIL